MPLNDSRESASPNAIEHDESKVKKTLDRTDTKFPHKTRNALARPGSEQKHAAIEIFILNHDLVRIYLQQFSIELSTCNRTFEFTTSVTMMTHSNVSVPFPTKRCGRLLFSRLSSKTKNLCHRCLRLHRIGRSTFRTAPRNPPLLFAPCRWRISIFQRQEIQRRREMETIHTPLRLLRRLSRQTVYSRRLS